jgi:hypothetical protein
MERNDYLQSPQDSIVYLFDMHTHLKNKMENSWFGPRTFSEKKVHFTKILSVLRKVILKCLYHHHKISTLGYIYLMS